MPRRAERRTPPASARRTCRQAKVPRHVAIVMDGNGRWAKQRGLPRTAGHEAGESSLFDCVEGAIELGVQGDQRVRVLDGELEAQPEEVRFLMGFNRDVIRRRRDEMHELGVRVRWAGRRPRLWRSVIRELEDRRGAHPRQRRPDPDHVRQLRRPGRDRRRRARRIAARGGRRPARPGQGRRARPSPGTSTSRTCPTSTCSCAARASSARQQLPAVAVGVRRARLRGHALAGLRPPPPVGGVRGVRRARPAPLRHAPDADRERHRGGSRRSPSPA